MGATYPSIAIVDDDDAICRALRRLTLSLSYDSVSFSSGSDFLASLDLGRPSCVLLDLQMPGLEGLDVLRLLRDRGVHIPVVIITGLDHQGMREQCFGAGAAAYLVKPLERSQIASAIEAALR